MSATATRRITRAGGVALMTLLAALGCGNSGGGGAAVTTAAPSTAAPGSTVAGTAAGSGTSSSAPAPPAAPVGAVVVAHRGASAYAPEHTFAAYDLGRTQGADYLEQDLQLTADGVLVVLHDATLDRTARGPAASCTGPVAEKTLAQIQQCDVGSWFNEAHPDLADPAYVGQRIPTLQQVLDRYGSDVRYYIEVKALTTGSGMEEPLLDLLADAGLLDGPAGTRRVLVQSFGADVLRKVHALRPELPLVQLVANPGSPVDVAALDSAREYAIAVGPASAAVDSAFVQAAHDRCLDVHPYTVDEPAEIDRLLQAGVDGLFTNKPDVLRTALQGRPPPPAHCKAGA